MCVVLYLLVGLYETLLRVWRRGKACAPPTQHPPAESARAFRTKQARGIISVDGVGNEWTLIWKLLANSVTLLVESERTWQWFHPQLLPWKQ